MRIQWPEPLESENIERPEDPSHKLLSMWNLAFVKVCELVNIWAGESCPLYSNRDRN